MTVCLRQEAVRGDSLCRHRFFRNKNVESETARTEIRFFMGGLMIAGYRDMAIHINGDGTQST